MRFTWNQFCKLTNAIELFFDMLLIEPNNNSLGQTDGGAVNGQMCFKFNGVPSDTVTTIIFVLYDIKTVNMLQDNTHCGLRIDH